jgi:hypothetical protein
VSYMVIVESSRTVVPAGLIIRERRLLSAFCPNCSPPPSVPLRSTAVSGHFFSAKAPSGLSLLLAALCVCGQ